MKVRTAGLKFKIATNFIWRAGHRGHHRDSTLPPYGWSSHEVNSETLFSPRYSKSSIEVVKRGDKVLVLLPRTSTNRSVPCSVCEGCPPRAKSIGRCSACSFKVDCVIVLSNRTNFIAPHEGSDRRIEVSNCD